MLVADVMSHEVHTCHGHSMLNEAARKMWDNDCGCLLVLNAEERPVAMLTDRDICMAAETQGHPIWTIPVSIAASRHFHTVSDRDSLEVAEATMRKHRVRRVPVLNDAGKPVGILSMNDLIRHAAAKRFRDKSLSPETIVDTLAAISAPRAQVTAMAAE